MSVGRLYSGCAFWTGPPTASIAQKMVHNSKVITLNVRNAKYKSGFDFYGPLNTLYFQLIMTFLFISAHLCLESVLSSSFSPFVFRFSAVQKHTVEFNQLAMANSEGSEAMLNRVMTKDNIGVAVLLEVRKEMMELSCE